MVYSVVIIGVIYNTFNEAVRFIKSIEFFEHKGIKLVLVDNSEKEPNQEFNRICHNSKLAIQYYRSDKNLGYFHGAQWGLEKYLNDHALPDWVVVSNVDILFTGDNLIEKLQSLEGYPRLGIVAPSIISSKWKTDYNPFLRSRYHKNRILFYKFIYSTYITQLLYLFLAFIKKYIQYYFHFFKDSYPSTIKNISIYAPHGACLMLKNNYFQEGGNLKHISFLYGEEIFIAETVAKLNLRVIYCPEIKIETNEHASVGFFYSRKIAGYLYDSILSILREYYN